MTTVLRQVQCYIVLNSLNMHGLHLCCNKPVHASCTSSKQIVQSYQHSKIQSKQADEGMSLAKTAWLCTGVSTQQKERDLLRISTNIKMLNKCAWGMQKMLTSWTSKDPLQSGHVAADRKRFQASRQLQWKLCPQLVMMADLAGVESWQMGQTAVTAEDLGLTKNVSMCQSSTSAAAV